MCQSEATVVSVISHYEKPRKPVGIVQREHNLILD
jgi:hypothetical protein